MSEEQITGIIQGAIGTLSVEFILGVIACGVYKYRFHRDEGKIFEFIKNSEHTFRSTEVIASELHLETRRIEHVAMRSKKIERNKKKNESWRMSY